MSRRSRRQTTGRRSGTGWFAKTAIGLLVFFLCAAGVFYAAVQNYLHSEGFRRLLSEKAGGTVGVSGKLSPLRWDGLAVESEAFQAEGTQLVRKLHMEGLHSEIGLSGLRRGVWEIRNARLRRVSMEIDSTYSQQVIPLVVEELDTTAPPSPAPAQKSWLPRELELQSLDLDELNVHALLKNGSLTASGMKIRAVPDGGRNSFQVEIRNGTIRTPIELLAPIQLTEARLRAGHEAVFLSKFSASAWSQGRIDATGEWIRDTKDFSLNGTVSGVKCEELLNETWAKRLIGTLSTDFTVNNPGGKPAARGRLVLKEGTLTALPVLDALAAYADTRRLRVLNLNEARADWKWTSDTLSFHDIVISSEGLARLEGVLQIQGDTLDGTLRLGLVPGTLASLPGAETHVFNHAERGLLWTTIKVTGTLEKPRENLSDRLIAAAGLRMLETLPESGEKVIKFTRNVFGEDSAKAVEKGVELIDKSGLNVEQVGGILTDILGVSRRKKDAEPVNNGQVVDP